MSRLGLLARVVNRKIATLKSPVARQVAESWSRDKKGLQLSASIVFDEAMTSSVQAIYLVRVLSVCTPGRA
jgi:hypothetical protein